MDCEHYREALSARLDGENPGIDLAELEAHLTGCGDCREWLADATRITRLARLQPLDVPDPTASILARVRADDAHRDGRRRGRIARALAVARVALFAVAAGQGANAAAELVDATMPGALPVHSARELGAFNLAVAVAFAWAAWRPAHARAQLPLIAAIVGILAACTLYDVFAGHVAASAEVAHLLLVAGLVLTVVVGRHVTGVGPPPSTLGQADAGRPPGVPPAPPVRPYRPGPAGPGAVSVTSKVTHRRAA